MLSGDLLDGTPKTQNSAQVSRGFKYTERLKVCNYTPVLVFYEKSIGIVLLGTVILILYSKTSHNLFLI